MIKPTLAEAKALASEYSVIPIAYEMFADQTTSIQALNNIRKKSDHYYLLESVVTKDNWSRYSFLGYNPSLVLSCTDGRVKRTLAESSTEKVEDPMAAISDILQEYNSPQLEGLPPFTGGLVGYFSYDCVKYMEPSLTLTDNNPEGFYDYQLMVMDKVIAFDHFRQKMILIANIKIDQLEANYQQAVEDLKDMADTLLTANDFKDSDIKQKVGEFEPLFTEEAFKRVVEKVQHHIVEGDIFQTVVSNRFSAPFEGSLLQTYRVLRTVNPSPYMVYFNFDDLEIACASPETLVSVRDGQVSSFPLAGTVPRGKDVAEDKALVEGLLANEKELSEHDMLVDLARNDVGKIAEFGSVKVTEYREIKQFSHVSHISSKVEGKVRSDVSALEVLAAALPAGTLSGAPKVRACQIIDQLEQTKRGPYGGALGYIDFTGNMEMCIGIRMAVRKNDKVFVQAGAGIVSESDPASEYQETKNKARAMMTALAPQGEQ